MIIKRRKNFDKTENTDEVLEQENVQEKTVENSLPPIPDTSSIIMQERAERRRGDRRRGYRRIDDRNLISRAHEEASMIREQAKREGFEQGIEVAKKELKKLGYAMSELLNARDTVMTQSQSEIAFIAIKVAEKIIKTQVECDDKIVLGIISDVLKEVGKNETFIVIKTNPQDVEIVKNSIPELFPYGGKQVRIDVEAQDDIERGSCMVETGSGVIDARFSTQLSIIKRAFEEGA